MLSRWVQAASIAVVRRVRRLGKGDKHMLRPARNGAALAGAASLDAAEHEEPQDYELEAYVVDDEDTRRRRVKAAVQTNDYIITEKYNHKDDYLHRNSSAPGGRLFAPMGMY